MSLPVSRVPDPMTAPSIRWGILGSGMIASAFAYAVRTGTSSTVAAVGSRDLDRARAFAAEHDVATAYGSYAELVAANVDVVYVASPHSEHREHALLALQAGKPILVEKAFTRNAAEAADVIGTAREHGLFCMEAMWSRFLPHYDVVRQLVGDGHLGRVHTVFADHGQLLWPGGPRRLADPALAGGALLDLGIYPVSFAEMVLGEPADLVAVGTLTPQGVDSTTSIVATSRSGAQAVLNATMAAKTPTTAVIAGDQARIEIDGDFYHPNTVRLLSTAGEPIGTWAYDLDSAHFGLRYEAAEVARCLVAGLTESPVLPTDTTLAIMRTLDRVRAHTGVRYSGE